MSRYTSDIVKQWVCDKVFNKNKASKDVLTAIQACGHLVAGNHHHRAESLRSDAQTWQLDMLTAQ